jgi:nitrogen-specific signal transduction histidine kinase
VIDYKEGVELEFIDSGNGIPEDIAKDIFMPFFTTKDVGKGTGLGLSLACKIIKIHKGEIRIDHSCKNTKFSIYLPKLQIKMAS